MTITFVGSGSGQQGANTTGITLTLPTHQADDFGIIYGRSDESGAVAVLSIGSATGWTELHNFNPTTGRDRVEYVWYKRLTSASETNPVLNTDTSQEHSASVHVFRGVDTVDPFDATFRFDSDANNSLPTNAAIESVTPNSCVVLFHGATHDDVSVAGAPSIGGTALTLGEAIIGGANDHRGQVTSYLLDAGAVGTKTPTAWTHTASPTTTAEFSLYTILLRTIQSVHLTDVDTDEKILPTQTDVIATGDGFEAVQGTGKVELVENSDYTGTKVSQTINIWSDLSVDFDVSQGALSEGIVYCFVTNDSGGISPPLQITLGFGPYAPNLVLFPDHFWTMNDNYDDTGEAADRPFDNIQTGTPDFIATPITRSMTHSFRIDQGVESSEVADSPFTNATNQHERRRLGGWIQIDAVQLIPGAIYEEGGGVNNFYFIIGYGNILLANCADSSASPAFKVQAYSDFKLELNRPYHIMLAFDGDLDGDEFYLLIDGVRQTVTSGNPIGNPDMSTHVGDMTFGRPDSGLDTGGTDIQYNASNTTLYSNWGTFSKIGGGIPSDIEIREQLFENGAIADDTLTPGSQNAMQTSIETFDGSTRGNWPMSFEIPGQLAGNDLELTATDIVFPDSISCHIRWLGSGTLTWRNGGTSNASIFSAPNGGSVSFVDTALVKFTVKNISDGLGIENARVLIEADSGGPLPSGETVTITSSSSPPLPATVTHSSHGFKVGDQVLIRGANESGYLGIKTITQVLGINSYIYNLASVQSSPATGSINSTAVVLTGLTDSNGEITEEVDFTSDQSIKGVVRKTTSLPLFKESPVSSTITTSGIDGNVFLVPD